MIDPELKQKFLDELSERPIISVVAKRLGISKATIYRWRKEDVGFAKELRSALSEGRGSITDLAEGKLIGAIQKSEKWAIQMWLEAHAKRFYKPRKAMAPAGRVLHTVNLKVNSRPIENDRASVHAALVEANVSTADSVSDLGTSPEAPEAKEMKRGTSG